VRNLYSENAHSWERLCLYVESFSGVIVSWQRGDGDNNGVVWGWLAELVIMGVRIARSQ